jgi:quercetin dioxygenase-like cupin family protein
MPTGLKFTKNKLGYNKIMKVIHLKNVEARVNDAALFTAPVTMKTIEAEKDNSLSIAYVSFPVGVRNKLHTHTNDQILIITEGNGIIANESEQQEITVGDVVVIPAGEKHWHGATENSAMTHIAISAAGTSIDQVEQ